VYFISIEFERRVLRVLNSEVLKISKKINFVIFHFVKSSLPFPGSAQWAGELYRVLYLI